MALPPVNFIKSMLNKGADVVVSANQYTPPALAQVAQVAVGSNTRLTIRNAQLLTAPQYNAIINAGPHHVTFDVS